MPLCVYRSLSCGSRLLSVGYIYFGHGFLALGHPKPGLVYLHRIGSTPTPPARQHGPWPENRTLRLSSAWAEPTSDSKTLDKSTHPRPKSAHTLSRTPISPLQAPFLTFSLSKLGQNPPKPTPSNPSPPHPIKGHHHPSLDPFPTPSPNPSRSRSPAHHRPAMSPPLAWAFPVIRPSKCGALSPPCAPGCCTRLHQAAWSKETRRKRDLHHHHRCPASGYAQGANRGDHRRSR
uniref:Uncharacterized protein n=1 Tax=Arundo donax TaxID=35708 RepID=A0A0A9D3B6_ARUDO